MLLTCIVLATDLDEAVGPANAVEPSVAEETVEVNVVYLATVSMRSTSYIEELLRRFTAGSSGGSPALILS
ncbi:hypothetical protein P3T76_013012 [Phytophthora citrophthora]|uniref:Uncharacterized protein n=1 Tax=Phytophthora citrophthora TaxID=4793 RepID=A0AAD9G4I1_9STRA|nr:hypothetical protein P3T76_013012 [Phytophthora citrophthora]